MVPPIQVSVNVIVQPLTVTTSVNPGTIYSGGTSQVKTTVTNQGAPVIGATMKLSTDKGSFTAVQDAGNGNYTSTYIAPDVTAQTTCTINVTALYFLK